MENAFDRISRRQKDLGLSDRALSMIATEGKNPDMMRDLRRRGTMPKGEVIDRLAEALETTVEWVRHGKSTGHVIADRRTGYDAEPEPSPFGQAAARTLPVYGTALGADVRFEDESPVVETHVVEAGEVIDWVRRPPMLENRKDVYALYITGSSMEPRFEPGDPVIVDAKRPPAPGDDVIVQLRRDNGEIEAVLIKRLVRRTAGYIELRQYNPTMTFQVPLSRVASVHRVLMMKDVIG